MAVMNKLTLSSVKNIIAIASGKGGVGKSTVAVNVALALHALGHKTGLLDADIYGPSQALMLGERGSRAQSHDGKTVQPILKYGIASMSMAYLMPEEKLPAIWRGPMASTALQQLLRDTVWGDLDYLVLDLPPGTGDIQLTMAQKIPVTGAIIVTTPQDIALIDARKAIEMFRRVTIPVLGMVENMSQYGCPQCGHVAHIFGHEGAAKLAQEYQSPLFTRIPLVQAIREDMDQGTPSVASHPEAAYSRCFFDIARQLIMRIEANREHQASSSGAE